MGRRIQIYKYHPSVTVENELIEIKKNNKKNYPKFIRFMDLYYEIYRLELTVCRGGLSKKMTDENSRKLLILEEEFNNLWSFMIRMDRENKNLEKYYIDFLEKFKYKKKELENRFKLKKCDYCDLEIIHISDISCEDCEEEFNLE